ncbi:MAG: leucine-rich repeat domain-containing protein [Chloroflexi bacterium]|nr:leucine-rich repeat domain-containing protein [Chloroflexota bacterium]MBI3340938.1 leucine-rich repeat domain-containing protein [Chloroflexota bacterium]
MNRKSWKQILSIIDNAARDSSDKLDLSGLEITTIEYGGAFRGEAFPLDLLIDELVRIKSLRTLKLSNVKLKKVSSEIGRLTNLTSLDLSNNQLATLPAEIGQLTQLQSLYLVENKLTSLPESLGQLKRLQLLHIRHNQLTSLPELIRQLRQLKVLDISFTRMKEAPEWLGDFTQLETLSLRGNRLTKLPESLGKLAQLRALYLTDNQLTDLPPSLAQIESLFPLDLDNNPLNPELAEAYKQGIESVKAYLRAKAAAQLILNEAKLVLVGEGGSGKTCLMDALLNNEWQEHPSTHGIEIKSFKVTDTDPQTSITLNGWDFGGQRVYRPTHQLFFSAPAVYLVVWKPREGSQAGQVKEWIKLVKHREPSAKILVVATHGGPQQRQPDIDRQELWDLFGKETVVDFFFVDSKPDAHGQRKGIEELKHAIARVAADLPEVGRSVPKSFADVRAALQARSVPYLPLDEVLAICRAHNMDDEIARLFLTISHRLGHLTHYQHDPALRDIVILRPDWLATAMSYVLDDEETRKAHGLVKFSRLNHLWDDPTREADSRYARTLHPIFLRLMERFDLSYRVADSSPRADSDPQSLIAQLVPDNRPENFVTSWLDSPSAGDFQQTQICRIVDDKGNTATAEGLFYQLIVRLHKYSLGRAHYADSVHWQRGLVLDDDYNGRALLEHKGNDVHITVRAPYPERFLAMLTEEVRYLVESFWEGLRCEVTVPCLNPVPCIGLFEVSKLMENLKRARPEQPCPVCNEWQSIERLLHNAPAASKPIAIEFLERQLSSIENKLDTVDVNVRRLRSQADKNFDDLIHLLIDEAKEGPRLFSLFPLDRSKFNPKEWIREKFRLVLWCEHSRLPLPVLNNGDMKKGVYDLDLDREWFKKASPYLKFLSGTLSMVLPVASSAVKLALDKPAYEAIEEQLNFGKSIIDATLGEATKLGEFMGAADSTDLEHGVAIRSDGTTLRELHALLKAKDPGFGGLVRVMNKRQEFLWVHERFVGEY